METYEPLTSVEHCFIQFSSIRQAITGQNFPRLNNHRCFQLATDSCYSHPHHHSTILGGARDATFDFPTRDPFPKVAGGWRRSPKASLPWHAALHRGWHGQQCIFFVGVRFIYIAVHPRTQCSTTASNEKGQCLLRLSQTKKADDLLSQTVALLRAAWNISACA